MSSTRIYELVVVAGDVADVVHSAGGWMFDRLMAGWRVSALVPADSDTRPLQILGVSALPFETAYSTVRASSRSALAVASSVIATDERVRQDVGYALSRGLTEVTFWGEPAPIDHDRRIDGVQYRLSSAARAFKTHALLATPTSHPQAEATEHFHRATSWCPPGGSDLARIS